MLHSTGRRRTARPQPEVLKYSHAIAPAAGSGALERALLAALRLRRPQVLERLAEQAGALAFASALAALSTRQMVDALLLLPGAQRAAVCAQLPPVARRRWHALAAQEETTEDRQQPAAAVPAPAHAGAARARLPRGLKLAWPWWRGRSAASAGAAAG
ncbi:hypothetical protein [Pulveribacter suum]|uniref:hypothetical protein n=1 Tax=Pulveribacter suum TaxID=2116657 RepID=UPI001D04F488|nr:hypothetical protein [Pulveribacter suum]